MTTVMTCSNFGLRNYGTIYGIVTMFMNVGLGVGPTIFGRIYDTTGAYSLAYELSLASLVVSIVLVFIARQTSSDQGPLGRIKASSTQR